MDSTAFKANSKWVLSREVWLSLTEISYIGKIATVFLIFFWYLEFHPWQKSHSGLGCVMKFTRTPTKELREIMPGEECHALHRSHQPTEDPPSQAQRSTGMQSHRQEPETRTIEELTPYPGPATGCPSRASAPVSRRKTHHDEAPWARSSLDHLPDESRVAAQGLHHEGGEGVEQAAQRSYGCPTPWKCSRGRLRWFAKEQVWENRGVRG